jgi:hypothetical protein
MKIYSTDFASQLIEAYVVEPLKTGTSNRLHAVVRDEEMLFPAHKDVFSLEHIRNMHNPSASLLLEWSESSEFSPVAEVILMCSAPCFVRSEEVVFRTDDLAFKISGEGWVIFCQSYTMLDISIRYIPNGYMPCIRKYPHNRDSLGSTCLIST